LPDKERTVSKYVLLEENLNEINARLKHYVQKPFRQPCIRYEGFETSEHTATKL
jgi:hypothetical protein